MTHLIWNLNSYKSNSHEPCAAANFIWLSVSSAIHVSSYWLHHSHKNMSTKRKMWPFGLNMIYLHTKWIRLQCDISLMQNVPFYGKWKNTVSWIKIIKCVFFGSSRPTTYTEVLRSSRLTRLDHVQHWAIIDLILITNGVKVLVNFQRVIIYQHVCVLF